MHARDTVDSEPPASSLPDSWPTETGRITHAHCFGRPRPRAPCYAAADTRGVEGRAAPVPASRPPSLAASAGTDVQAPGWRGGGVDTSSAGRGHRGHRHRAQAWRAFSLHLTSCLCHPSATPSLLGDEPHADPTAGADVTPSQLVQGQKTKQPFLCRCRFTKLV